MTLEGDELAVKAALYDVSIQLRGGAFIKIDKVLSTLRSVDRPTLLRALFEIDTKTMNEIIEQAELLRSQRGHRTGS